MFNGSFHAPPPTHKHTHTLHTPPHPHPHPTPPTTTTCSPWAGAFVRNLEPRCLYALPELCNFLVISMSSSMIVIISFSLLRVLLVANFLLMSISISVLDMISFILKIEYYLWHTFS
ncbi:hypothetical protein T492DRAFT_924390 [Pavlovales sp. CCMP2436]|nr:hypothetical protein T492DRAFT_924390 [Pavlovales sp. CCMP2436]